MKKTLAGFGVMALMTLAGPALAQEEAVTVILSSEECETVTVTADANFVPERGVIEVSFGNLEGSLVPGESRTVTVEPGPVGVTAWVIDYDEEGKPSGTVAEASASVLVDPCTSTATTPSTLPFTGPDEVVVGTIVATAFLAFGVGMLFLAFRLPYEEEDSL